jgi:hypothetical protein
MKALFIFVLFIISNGLVYAQTNDSTFNLATDIFNFSELMTEKDTLRIKTDMWICENEREENDLIIKQGDSVIIHVQVFENGKKFDFGIRKYEPKKYDTLTFENLFLKLENRVINRERTSKTIEIIHNRKDTLTFCTHGLMEKLFVSNYTWKIKDQIYFDKNYYKPLPIPPKPKGQSDLKKLDSLNRLEIEKELQRMIND